MDNDGSSYSRLWPQVLPRHQTDTVTRVWKHGKKPARVKYRGYELILTYIIFFKQLILITFANSFFPFQQTHYSFCYTTHFFYILVPIILPTPLQILKPPSVKSVWSHNVKESKSMQSQTAETSQMVCFQNSTHTVCER